MTRRLAVVLLLLPVLGAAEARAGEDPDLDRAVRTLLREQAPREERLEAATRVLEAAAGVDAATALRGGTALLGLAPEVGGWLVLRGLDRGWVEPEVRAAARARIDELLAGSEAPPADRATWTALGLRLGRRPEDAGAVITASWPPSTFVAAVLDREVAAGGDVRARDAADVRAAIDAERAVRAALDRAAADEDAEMEAGLDALLGQGEAALPVLLHEVRRYLDRPEPGWTDRVSRALLVLGLLGRREATPTAVAALDAPDGFVQAAAATALGDIGDPASAVALCWKICYRGDLLRDRDQWDYPYSRPTDVKPEDWATVQYFVVDVIAVDALLRMGADGAMGWLLEKKLDPRVANFRIRVYQDAVDTVRRNVAGAPIAAYQVDQGWPQRWTAFRGLHAWWHAHRLEHVTPRVFPADDEAFRRTARAAAERLRGRSVMELMIAQETCGILGPAMTPTLVETLEATHARTHQLAIVEALGLVRDPAAVPVLIRLLDDRVPVMRAKAASALAPYVDAVPAAEEALRGALADPAPGVRLAALKGLVAAPPSPELAALARAAAERTQDDRETAWALDVLRLVQEGPEHWAAVGAWLRHDERYVRRDVWDLLRAALALPASLHDAGADPKAAGWVPPDEAAILEALAARRGTR